MLYSDIFYKIGLLVIGIISLLSAVLIIITLSCSPSNNPFLSWDRTITTTSNYSPNSVDPNRTVGIGTIDSSGFIQIPIESTTSIDVQDGPEGINSDDIVSSTEIHITTSGTTENHFDSFFSKPHKIQQRGKK